MKITTITALAAALIAVGCGAEEASFSPTENVNAESRTGQAAAAYNVRSRSGPVAKVNVWASGAYRSSDHQTIVQMGVEVQNRGNNPVALDTRTAELDLFDKNGQPLPRATLVSVVPPGAPMVAAGQAQDFDLYFALPPEQVKPGKIGSLRFRWALAHDSAQRYVQFTDFRRNVNIYPGYYGYYGYEPIYGYYDPWWWGPGPVYYHHHVPVQRVIIRHEGGHYHRH